MRYFTLLVSCLVFNICRAMSPATGLFDWILNSIDCGCDRPDNLNVSKTRLYLYNYQSNTSDVYNVGAAADLIFQRPDFDPEQCIHIFIPGFGNTKDNRPSGSSRCTFERLTCKGKRALALIIDHSEYTNFDIMKDPRLIDVYKESVIFTKSIGIYIGRFVAKLLSKVDKKYIHIVGHSLGAHIAGYVGRTVKNETGDSLKSIYAVDPAGPCFETCLSEHVSRDSADFVVTFHCNAGEFGTIQNLSHYDFYSGNGISQKYCGFGSSLVMYALKSFCSHIKCVPIVYNSALSKGLWNAVKCSSADDYLNGMCNHNEATLVGYRRIPRASYGVYFFMPSDDLYCRF